MKNKIHYLFTLVCLITIFSCTTQKYVIEKNKPETIENNSSWNLTQDNEIIKGIYNKNVNLIFNIESNTVKGFAGCNEFSANIELDNNSIKFVDLNIKNSKCPNTQSEIAFISVLKNVNNLKVKSNELLFFKNNILLMKFSRQ